MGFIIQIEFKKSDAEERNRYNSKKMVYLDKIKAEEEKIRLKEQFEKEKEMVDMGLIKETDDDCP